VMTVAVVPSRLALNSRRRSPAKSGAGQPASLGSGRCDKTMSSRRSGRGGRLCMYHVIMH